MKEEKKTMQTKVPSMVLTCLNIEEQLNFYVVSYVSETIYRISSKKAEYLSWIWSSLTRDPQSPSCYTNEKFSQQEAYILFHSYFSLFQNKVLIWWRLSFILSNTVSKLHVIL